MDVLHFVAFLTPPGTILHRLYYGRATSMNEFAVVIEQRGKTVLVVGVPKRRVSGDAIRGTEEPVVPTPEVLAVIGAAESFEVQVGKALPGHGNEMWAVWDGRPQPYHASGAE